MSSQIFDRTLQPFERTLCPLKFLIKRWNTVPFWSWFFNLARNLILEDLGLVKTSFFSVVLRFPRPPYHPITKIQKQGPAAGAQPLDKIKINKCHRMTFLSVTVRCSCQLFDLHWNLSDPFLTGFTSV